MATNGILLGQNNNNNNNSSFQIGDICESTLDKGKGWYECDGSVLTKTDYSELYSTLKDTPLGSNYGYFLFKNLETSIPEDLSSSEKIISITICGQYYKSNIMALAVRINTSTSDFYYLYYCTSSSPQDFQDISNYTKIYIDTISLTKAKINLYIFSGSTGTEIAFMVPDRASRTYSRGSIYIISISSNSIIKTFTKIYNNNKATDSNYYYYDFFFCQYKSSLKVYYCGTNLGEIFVSTSDTSMELRAYIGSFTSVRYFNSYYYNDSLILRCYQDSSQIGHIMVHELDISDLVNNYTASNPGTLPYATISDSFGNSKSSFCSCFLPTVNNYWYAYFLDKTTGKGYYVRSSQYAYSFSTQTTQDLAGILCLKNKLKEVFVYKKSNYYLLKTEDGTFEKIIYLDDFPSDITNRYPITSKGFMVLEQEYTQIPPSEDNAFTKKYIKVK